MSNIEYIDGTVRVGDIAHITLQDYTAVKSCLGTERIQLAVNYLVLTCGYSPAIAELIVLNLFNLDDLTYVNNWREEQLKTFIA